MDSSFSVTSDVDSDNDLNEAFYDSSGISSYLASSSASPSPTKEPPATSLHWFRMSSLRLHDNPALLSSLNNSKTQFRGVFIVDTWFVSGKQKFGVNRWRFLIECLHDIKRQLESMNLQLYVARGSTTAVLSSLCKEWNVTHLTYQISQEPHSSKEESVVDQLATTLDVTVEKFHSHTLYNPASIVDLNHGKPVITIKTFRSLFPKLGYPSLPVPSPDVDSSYLEDDTPQHILKNFQIPTLEELGLADERLDANPWIGGETEALHRLSIYCESRSKPFEDPSSMLFDKTSLSPYIRFGCLSVRYFWQYVHDLSSVNKEMEKVMKDVISKLLQREFYFTVASQVPNFDSDTHNPVCVPLPWENEVDLLHKWKYGFTGYPWIDAGMRQMHQEGWIHHCLRESVAAFLTRGDLWISWVHGKDTFEEFMLDFEPSVSCGCWMRSSACSFITGRVEHYCPVTYGQQIDPEGKYIRQFVPELEYFPKEYIYSPWMAPIEVQKQSGCVVGIDYPYPIIDHMTAGTICVERLKNCLCVMSSKVT